jgi:2'-5' RNA ligase
VQLRAQKAGFFPNSRRPRILWIGLTDEREELVRLQTSVERASERFTEERLEERFTAHVTIARIKALGGSDAEVLTRLVGGISGRVFGAWKTNEIELVRSEHNDKGARYTVLARIPLEEHS